MLACANRVSVEGGLALSRIMKERQIPVDVVVGEDAAGNPLPLNNIGSDALSARRLGGRPRLLHESPCTPLGEGDP